MKNNKIFTDVWDVNEKKLSIADAVNFVSQSQNGAINLFVGTVRELNQGKKVLSVSYDIFEPLAKRSFLEIAEKTQKKWGGDHSDELFIYLVHGKGKVLVGDLSVVIAVGSIHRDEAFCANRYIIEQVKHRCPIWKLENYADGTSIWSKGCELCGDSDKNG